MRRREEKLENGDDDDGEIKMILMNVANVSFHFGVTNDDNLSNDDVKFPTKTKYNNNINSRDKKENKEN